MSVLGFLLVRGEVVFSIDVNVLTSLFDVFKKAFKSPFIKSTKNFTVITPKSIKFLFLSLIGKRPSVIKMKNQAKERKIIYDKLKVFQTENGEK